MSETRCDSCTMPIESGPYCQYCTNDQGTLHPFEETFERFKQFSLRQNPTIENDALEREVYQFMSTTTAWKDHPKVKSRVAGS